MNKLSHSQSHRELPSSGTSGIICAVVMAVAGCAEAPKLPVTDVSRDKGGTTVTEYCVNPDTRACEKRVYRNGELMKSESTLYNCNSRKFNGATCSSPRTIIYTPPSK